MAKFLTGEKIYLRGLTKDDCRGSYWDMVNDVENLLYVEGLGRRPISQEELVEYVESNNKNASSLLVGIFENDSDAHVGNIHLSNIKPYHNNCILGIIMHHDFMGKGYAFEASTILIRHAFTVLNLNRIQINVVDKNVKAIKLYEKLGARKEGVLREALYCPNGYRDLIVYSILRKDFMRRAR